MELDHIIKRFLLGEAKANPDLQSYIQSLGEILDSIRPSSMRETRRIQIARKHLTEIKRTARQLQERVSLLEEQISVLEESNVS